MQTRELKPGKFYCLTKWDDPCGHCLTCRANRKHRVVRALQLAILAACAIHATYFVAGLLTGDAAMVAAALPAAGIGFAAVTVTVNVNMQDFQQWLVTATADGDTTTGAITHMMGANPHCMMAQLVSQALTALSAWSIAITQTTWTGTKLASTGSGNGSAQLQVTLIRSSK